MLTIPLDNHSPLPLYEQIYSYIKQEILSAHLASGTKLPSTRNLSTHLQVSRNTIDMAYSQLQSEGYIDAVPQKGYFVNQVSSLVQLETKEPSVLPEKIQKETSFLYNFSIYDVDLKHFPYHTWRQLSKNCLTMDNDLFLLGDKDGDMPFRRSISQYLRQSRNVICSPEQIIVGAGVDYLLQVLISLFSKETLIAMENPTYKKAYQIFSGLGNKVTGISLDEKGLNVTELKESNASLVYVTPSHQFPLGTVMPISRRLELLEWAAQKEGRYILEDDHDSEFRYKGKPIPSLQGIDSKGTVIYIGTFSKAIAPSIRVGYMVLPLPLLEHYQKTFYYCSNTVSRFDQSIITEFLEKGYFERHLNRMRKIYKNKHDILIQSLKIFGNSIRITGENAGLHIVLELLINASEKEILHAAQNAGIKLYGLSNYFITPKEQKDPTFLLGYGNLSENEITEGIHILYHVIKKQGWII